MSSNRNELRFWKLAAITGLLLAIVSLTVSLTDIQTTTGTDFDTGTNDLSSTFRGRLTDRASCSPGPPCGGPYEHPATGTDLDFGSITFECIPNGDPAQPPGATAT